jgi:hypothetical protein
MTRTDVMASSRPRTAGESATRKSFARVRRTLLLMPVLALLAFALAGPTSAIAASGSESGSGYNSKPSEPGSGTSPSKESESPSSKEEPSTSPSTGKEAKSSTLPFTGLDLRWTFAVGIVLMGAGFSIVVVQRRSRRGDSP